jgi:membrane dipeptidase
MQAAGASDRGASELHDEAIVVEGHAHTINAVIAQGIDPWKEQATGTFDYARARRGGVDMVFEHLYVEDEYNDYNYTVKQACRLIECFYRTLEANRDRMELALDAGEVRRVVARGRMAVVLALEGGFDMEGDPEVLRLFHRLGVRAMQFVNHDTTNAMADSWAEARWGGVSAHGREIIREMNRLGILIDISHASDAAKRGIIDASDAPVVSSHNGLKRFSSFVGNLEDDTLRAMAAKGGLVGLHSAGWILQQRSLDWGYYGPHNAPAPPSASPPRADPIAARQPRDLGDYIRGLDARMRDKWLDTYGYGQPWRERQREALRLGAPLPTVEDWAHQVRYVVETVGADHVGIGLDMMSGGHWLRDFDATCYPRLTQALLAEGLSRDTVRKILGESWLRVLEAATA